MGHRVRWCGSGRVTMVKSWLRGLPPGWKGSPPTGRLYLFRRISLPVTSLSLRLWRTSVRLTSLSVVTTRHLTCFILPVARPSPSWGHLFYVLTCNLFSFIFNFALSPSRNVVYRPTGMYIIFLEHAQSSSRNWSISFVKRVLSASWNVFHIPGTLIIFQDRVLSVSWNVFYLPGAPLISFLEHASSSWVYPYHLPGICLISFLEHVSSFCKSPYHLPGTSFSNFLKHSLSSFRNMFYHPGTCFIIYQEHVLSSSWNTPYLPGTCFITFPERVSSSWNSFSASWKVLNSFLFFSNVFFVGLYLPVMFFIWFLQSDLSRAGPLSPSGECSSWTGFMFLNVFSFCWAVFYLPLAAFTSPMKRVLSLPCKNLIDCLEGTSSTGNDSDRGQRLERVLLKVAEIEEARESQGGRKGKKGGEDGKRDGETIGET